MACMGKNGLFSLAGPPRFGSKIMLRFSGEPRSGPSAAAACQIASSLC